MLSAALVPGLCLTCTQQQGSSAALSAHCVDKALLPLHLPQASFASPAPIICNSQLKTRIKRHVSTVLAPFHSALPIQSGDQQGGVDLCKAGCCQVKSKMRGECEALMHRRAAVRNRMACCNSGLWWSHLAHKCWQYVPT
jgi:hypothetical protein